MEATHPIEPTPSDAGLVLLNDIEARVLGCLIEKQATTPEVYPLTINAAVVACNQKTNRDPLMNLEPGAVAHALRQMEGRGLTRTAYSSRALRYEHRADEVYGLMARPRAILCALLLRGPQTLGELFIRTERLGQFPSIDDVRDTLERMMQRSPALVTCLGRGAGQREDRYMHLLCGPVSAEDFAAQPQVSASPRTELEQRVRQLEEQVEELRQAIEELRQR